MNQLYVRFWRGILALNYVMLEFLVDLYRYQITNAGPSHPLQERITRYESEMLRIEMDLKYVYTEEAE